LRVSLRTQDLEPDTFRDRSRPDSFAGNADALIEPEPFRLSFGQVRRRPPVYAASAIVMAVTSLALRDAAALWIATGLAMMAAVAVLRRPARETVLTYSADTLALGAGVLWIGLDPLAAMALWSAIVVVAYFGLPRRHARFVFAAAVTVIAITLFADGRLALLDLSAGGRTAVSVALPAIGFGYLATVVPSLADTTRQVLRSADESTAVQRREAEFRADLASMVAHELRNPLAGIKGFIGVLASEGDRLPPDERAEYLAIVESQTASLEGIVEDLLVAVQSEQGKVKVDRRPFDVGPLINRVVIELGPGAAETVTVDVEPWCSASGDPSRVSQILRNLLSNARKYGGPNVVLRCEAVGEMVRITVHDDGSGIAPSQVERVFERFEGTATGSGGYGLGLPIARELAQAMGGDLIYEQGHGAKFVLTLPVT
jgi:signal transduction histidine kinase